MASLDQLALKYGTDKGSTDHSYCEYYEQYLSKWRDEPIALLELGVYRGASLRMWREYFPNATIIGLDRQDPLPELEASDIIQAHGEQDNEKLINKIGSNLGLFHVVIDDASHISSKTIASFKLLWPHLKPGGVYVIEDLQTSYDVKHYTQREAWDDPAEQWHTAMGFCTRLAHEVNRSLFPEKYRLGYDVASVQFFPNICFITKAG